MHSALWQLLWFDLRGSLRGLANIRRNFRQVILFLLVLAFIGFLFWARTQGQSAEEIGNLRFGQGMPFWSLIYLSLTWLTASADRGLVMRPAEIHFVAGGPFRDHDVITLNLVRLASRALVGGSVLALLASAYVNSYLSAMVGMWLMISASLLVGMNASLASRSAQGSFVKRLRRLFNALAIGSLVLLVWQSLGKLREAGVTPSFSEVAAIAPTTDVGKLILPPLAWMFAPMSAESFVQDTLPMLPIRLLVIGGLVGFVYLLGGRYLEASTQRTDLSMAKRRAAQRSGVAGRASSRTWTAKLSLPTFGRLGGVGSVAWMQILHSIRVLPGFLVFTIAIVGLVVVIPMSVDRDGLQGRGLIAWMAGLITYADFLLLLQLPVGFLGPVAQREMLKSLPLSSTRIVLGQLAGPVVPMAVIHTVVTILFVCLVPSEWNTVLFMSLGMIPMAVVLIANVNLLGLWNIIKPRALQQRDILAAGRAMVSVWIFFVLLTPAIIAGSIFGAIAAVFSGGSLITIMAAASFGVACSSVLYIAGCAWTFSRWQPSAAEGGKEEQEHDR